MESSQFLEYDEEFEEEFEEDDDDLHTSYRTSNPTAMTNKGAKGGNTNSNQ